jgi:hypothetical protein
MKRRNLNLFSWIVLGCALVGPASSYAQSGALGGFLGSAGVDQLFAVLPNVMNANGTPPADIGWPGYRLMDANGVTKVFSDVMGPDSSNATFSTSSHLLWSGAGQLRPQTMYADFGGTCDLNNPPPGGYYPYDYSYPLSNYGNDGMVRVVSPTVQVSYQSGTYSTCGGSSQFSQNVFSPIPLLTREAWMYRACRVLSVTSTAEQIAMLASRVRAADPTAGPSHPGGIGVAVDAALIFADGATPPAYNWCDHISAPADSDYQSLFRAFYPGRSIPKIVSPEVLSGAAVRTNAVKPRGKGAPAWAALLGIQEAGAQFGSAIPVYNPTPQYQEKLMEVVGQSNIAIDAMSPIQRNTLENVCVSGGSIAPVDKIKAVNAWRAILLTMCMDPGWQVL